MGFFGDLKEYFKDLFSSFSPWDSPAVWGLKETDEKKCPKCGKKVKGQRVIVGNKGYGGVNTFKTNEKCGEIKDQHGNKADIYREVKYSWDDYNIRSEYYYQYKCTCGKKWKSDVKKSNHT